MSIKVLIATRSFGSTSPQPMELFKVAGIEVIQADISQEMTEDRLIELLDGVQGAVIGVVPMTARVLECARELRVVSMHGVGVNHIDLPAASRLGITIANCPGTNDEAVADLAIGLMLCLARSLPAVEEEVRGGGWGSHKGVELWKKRLGLVGFGRIGRAVARRALGFEMQVLAYDPYLVEQDIRMPAVSLSTFQNLLTSSDFISLHAALNEGTQKLFSTAQFEAMKPTAYLINTARGELVDEEALYQALTSKRIAGAALDVYAKEPPRNSPLLQLDNVVLTPHIGAHTREAITRMSLMAAENVIRVLQGNEPHHRVV